MSSDDSIRIQFLPLPGTGVVIPLGDLAPGAIRAACGHTALVRGGTGAPRGTHQALLNHVGFSLGLEQWSPDALHGTLREIESVGGRRRVNLFARSGRMCDFELRASPRQVCDRIFHGGDQVRTIYTGYGVPFEQFDDVALWLEGNNERPLDAQSEGRFDEHLRRVERGDASTRRSFVATYSPAIHHVVFNFLGDAFVNQGSSATVVPTTHSRVGPLSEHYVRLYQRVGEVLLETLRDLGGGWARVHRLTDRLVALVMPNGDYDVLVRGTRDKPPVGWVPSDTSWISDAATDVPMLGLRVPGQPDDGEPLSLLPEAVRPDLRPGPERLPSVVGQSRSVLEDYYFTDRWEERDRHQAERAYHAYYMSAPEGQIYRGPDTALEAYLRGFRHPGFSTPARPVGNFMTVTLPGGRTLSVQELPLTLAQARAVCPEISLHARFDEANASLATASVSYLEALELCAAFEDKLGSPVRLLSASEYQLLAGGPSPSFAANFLEWLMPEDPTHRLHYNEFALLGNRGGVQPVEGELKVRWRRTRAGEPLHVRLCHD